MLTHCPCNLALICFEHPPSLEPKLSADISAAQAEPQLLACLVLSMLEHVATLGCICTQTCECPASELWCMELYVQCHNTCRQAPAAGTMVPQGGCRCALLTLCKVVVRRLADGQGFGRARMDSAMAYAE